MISTTHVTNDLKQNLDTEPLLIQQIWNYLASRIVVYYKKKWIFDRTTTSQIFGIQIRLR